VVLLLVGCSMPSGNQLTFFPEGHRLLDSTKAVRVAASGLQPLARELDKLPLPSYVIEPGDVLLVQPVDLDSPIRLPSDQPVLPDGTISLGRYGRILVAGRTVEEVEQTARSLVGSQAREVGPIVVRIVSRTSKVYYVLGEVNAPGAFPLTGRETVLDGILAAGGLSHRASRRHIVLSRPTRPDSCRVVLPICFQEIVQLGDTSTNYQLAPGDRIFVPTRSFTEDFFHKKPECPPCGGAQAPCPFLQESQLPKAGMNDESPRSDVGGGDRKPGSGRGLTS
jgi:protein involved in polysaccharide export with SLBB domain